MKTRKFVLSVALGAMLTLGLLVGFSLSHKSAMASDAARDNPNVLRPSEALGNRDAVSTAHVVVQFSDGDTSVRPITWTDAITRIAALKAAGFNIEHSGEAVCSIDGDGCPAASCFTCGENFWGQGEWAGTAWAETYSPPNLLARGDVIAFRNGTKPDYSDFGLTGFLPGASTYLAASDALEWMGDQQEPDGGYDDGFDRIGASLRALIAVGSAGYDPDEWGDPSLLHFLTVVSRTETVAYAANNAKSAGKLALGAAWSGQTVTDFAGINLPMSITAYYSDTTGAYGVTSEDTAWAVLGMHAAGEEIPTKTIGFLEETQNADGGWTWNDLGTSSTVQETALRVQALLAAGEPPTSTVVADALEFIHSGKNSDGGYGYTPDSPSGVSTTAYVIQSLLSAGQDSSGNWCPTIRYHYLLSRQMVDGGFEAYSPLYGTQEAIPALMHQPYGSLAEWTYNCYFNYLPQIANGTQ